jgi:5-oxoprolinase (ATP-hydrolysing) subunit A
MILDLNCDLGEGSPHDAELMPLITTANVACGFHAGDPPTAMATLRLAKQHGVRVGAHPSFPDREHFGRRELTRSVENVFADCIYQVGGLAGLAREFELELTHLKPHGALYNMAARDELLAGAMVKVAEQFQLSLMGLPGTQIEALCPGRVPFISEGFADRRYRPDGTLVPRSEPDAFVHTPAEAVTQALALLKQGKIRTLCVHGDNPQAVVFVRELRAALLAEGVTIQSFA